MKIWCPAVRRYSRLVKVSRFELELHPPKGRVLPLHYTLIHKDHSLPITDLRRAKALSVFMVQKLGFEPRSLAWKASTLAVVLFMLILYSIICSCSMAICTHEFTFCYLLIYLFCGCSTLCHIRYTVQLVT